MSGSAAGFRNRGVTLMELLVVVAIIGILSAIAIPSYRQYMMRVNRTDAKRDLMTYAQILERCFTRGNDYTLGACTVNFGGGLTNPEGTYTTTAVVAQTTFVLTATPIGGQANDTKCGTFTLNQASQQTVSGSLGLQKCWGGGG
jgi:type IV pilus assembly protein PilE